MSIEIKNSEKPIKYEEAIQFMEKRLKDLNEKKQKIKKTKGKKRKIGLKRMIKS